MDSFALQLNTLLTDTFWTILKVEEQMLKNNKKIDLTIGELHLIESVGGGGEKGRTISDLAAEMGIKRPSVTVAVNKLVAKGYVEKQQMDSDKRVINVTLTRLGKKMDSVHRYFHEHMIRNIGDELDQNERNTLTAVITKLNLYFQRQLDRSIN